MLLLGSSSSGSVGVATVACVWPADNTHWGLLGARHDTAICHNKGSRRRRGAGSTPGMLLPWFDLGLACA